MFSLPFLLKRHTPLLRHHSWKLILTGQQPHSRLILLTGHKVHFYLLISLMSVQEITILLVALNCELNHFPIHPNYEPCD
jgi:hypothetical protein